MTTDQNTESASWRYFPAILGTIIGSLLTLLFVGAGVDSSTAVPLGAGLASIGYTIQAAAIACQPNRFPGWRFQSGEH